jgi:glycosyltransferase involved in cell wall biosynthesis
MRILFTLNSSNIGGMEKTVLDLVKGLPGFKKYVICPEGDYFDNFKEFALVTKYSDLKKLDFNYIKIVRKLIKENKIDIIHANEPKVVFNTLLACLFTPVKLRITHTHTPISMWQVPLFSKIINILMNSTAVNLLGSYEVALTPSIRDQKIKEGILPSKIKIIPNSLDSNFIKEVDFYKTSTEDRDFIKKNINPKLFTFLMLSRFTKEKNQIFLVNVFYEFLKKYPNSELILAGKGSDYTKIKNRVRDLNLESKVKILTQISDRNKINLYKNCDCFVFTTLAEGFGITLLEAMYSCYPVISSNLKVLKEVSNNNVLFFKSNNSKSLFSKMEEAYKIKDSISQLKDNQKFISENYKIERYIDNYLNLYKL